MGIKQCLKQQTTFFPKLGLAPPNARGRYELGRGKGMDLQNSCFWQRSSFDLRKRKGIGLNYKRKDKAAKADRIILTYVG